MRTTLPSERNRALFSSLPSLNSEILSQDSPCNLRPDASLITPEVQSCAISIFQGSSSRELPSRFVILPTLAAKRAKTVLN